MVATLGIWIYLLAAPVLIGWAGSAWLTAQLHSKDGVQVSPALYWLLGMAIFSSLFSLFSLGMPLGLPAQIILVLLTVLAFMYLGRSHYLNFQQFFVSVRSTPTLLLILAGLTLVSILFNAQLKPANFDTGLYHAQAIRWIETYPAIPGLANFHNRLGYNSSWLLTQALFSFSFLKVQSFHLNSSALFVVASLYFLAGLRNLWQGSRQISDGLRTLFFPLVFYVLASQISSPGNDAPVTLITWMVACEWVAYFENGQSKTDIRPIVLALISVYAVTIKLSALPLCLAALIVFTKFLFKRRWKVSVLALALSTLIMIPWMARNVILSGYLVYPFPALDLFKLDWKVPLASVQREVESIQTFARLPHLSREQVQALSFRSWFSQWFYTLTFNRRTILILDLLAPFGLLLFALMPRLRPLLKRHFLTTWPIWLTTYLGLLYWFWSSPAFRFGTGFIFAALVLILSIPLLSLQAYRPHFTNLLPRLLGAFLIVYMSYFLVSSADFKTLSTHLLLPADYPSSPSQPCQTAQQSIMVPEESAYNQCWYGIFPCIPGCNHDFELRGIDWRSGFRYKPDANIP